jgi:hypothetical protein
MPHFTMLRDQRGVENFSTLVNTQSCSDPRGRMELSHSQDRGVEGFKNHMQFIPLASPTYNPIIQSQPLPYLWLAV